MPPNTPLPPRLSVLPVIPQFLCFGARGRSSVRYVSEEGAYWLTAGWPVGAAGMMEGGGGSPGADASASPQDEASGSESKRPDSKKCGVCGDRALGYNFNAITCESCKAFFRRNALKNKEFRCPFQDSCKVDQVTRRFCQKCRLRKCFEIGMKKEWIMTEEEKQRKKQKIEENRARKLGDVASDEEGSKHPTAYSPFPALAPVESKPQAVVVGVIRGEEEAAAKVLRVDGQTDIHSQDRMIIHATGNAAERLPPAALMSASREYSSDYTNSPEHRDMLPQCSGEQEYSGSSLTHSAVVPQFLPHCHEASSPGKTASLDDEGLRSFSPAGSVLDHKPVTPFNDHKDFPLLGDDSCSLHTKQEAADNDSPAEHPGVVGGGGGGGGGEGGGGVASPSSSNPGNSLSMADVVAMNIKKEVEYPDETVTLCSGDEQLVRTELQSHQEDWKNFSVQDTLRFLEPGCKQSPSATGLTMMDSIMNTAISAEYSAFSLLGSNNPRELNEPEKMKLNELSEANKGLLAPLCEDYNFKDLSNPSLINIINLTEIAIRRLIKMSKRISAFKSLCQEDQIALLKGGCTEMMILRSVCAYDPDKDSWMIQQDHDRFKNIKLKVLKAAPGNVYEEHKKFILAFQPEWRQDHNIIFLLSAITLFTPERPNIIHGDAIKHEQCSYLYLLKRYLECKYGGCEGRTVYLRLLERIKHLHILNENHIRVFLEVNPQEVEPLLIEIFDLKHR
ncbi:nuclear hormone receptor family member daf-12-like isoform X3 [Penaeus japonicus]|uniref:nuclear hormone receptor family member daf-12-like isoform X3 n=1 Tax=Penaeus japonicus TaxID=27405 RepID=UPI001C7106D4|nr:nuclear hormone receptor family member daf-12-like isoform X3 [Penaeus japonicus]